MVKIAFYLNLQGAGHCRRFEAIASQIPTDCELAVMGMDKQPPIKDVGRFVERVHLPGFGPPPQNDFLHQQTLTDYHNFWVNQGGNTAFVQAMVTFLARWKPDILVADVGLEAAVLGRMCGTPVIYGRQHGQRWDKGHTLAYEWSSGLLAPFSSALEQPDCPRWIRRKTFYSGGFSRFSNRKRPEMPPKAYAADCANILVTLGFGGTNITFEDVAIAAKEMSHWRWHLAGVQGPHDHPLPQNLFCHGVIDDIWPYLCHADLVVSNAGHNSVMEIATARSHAIIIPAERPFAEQICKAQALASRNLCVVSDQWPLPSAWPQLYAQAKATDPLKWSSVQSFSAQKKAADYLYGVASQCAQSS